MKKFSILILSLFGIACLSAQQREYVIAVHGGAGAIASWENNPAQAEMYYASLDTALMIGDSLLSKGEEGEKVVMAVVNYLENNPLFNAGKGATVSADGTFELDASIMTGKDLKAGAVAGVKTIKNPINAAYAVMTQSPHVMLSGEGADRFAAEQGLEIVDDNMYFATPRTLEWIEKFKQESEKNGTVGCVVLDKNGNLAAGTSTGGMLRKKWGRIGDSPVIGAGTYADNNSCAVSGTGHGEYFLRHVVAFNICARFKYLNETVTEAADYIIHKELSTEAGNGGVIAIDKEGNIAMPFNSGGMFRGYLYKEKASSEIVKKVGIGKELTFASSSCKQAPDDFEKILKVSKNAIIVDVRTAEEMAEGHIKGAILADVKKTDFEEIINKWDKSKTYFIYCRSGGRSQTALSYMRKAGFKQIHELKGGFNAWKAADKPMVK